MGQINVAIIGVGNCASSLVQGIYKYAELDENAQVPGIMHPVVGGYHIGDIKVVAAFDVDKEKVGKDLSEAIHAGHNNTVKFHDVPHTGVKVSRGMTHDGLGKYLSEIIEKAPPPSDDFIKILRDRKVDVVINYLPVGSEQATKYYVEQVLAAGAAFVNCIPVFIAGDPTGYWPKRFEDKGLPIVGDDIKSQVGATIIHRNLTRLFEDRGVKIDRTYQLNFGGNTDFLNMLERERLMSKKISKTQSVKSQMDHEILPENMHIGPSDFVPWLLDRKWAYIRLEGTSFGNVPLNVEVKLEVHDSPNSAGVVIDAVRCAKIGLDRGMAGPLVAPSAYFMKSPPKQFRDDEARRMVDDFIQVAPAQTVSGAGAAPKRAGARSRKNAAAPTQAGKGTGAAATRAGARVRKGVAAPAAKGADTRAPRSRPSAEKAQGAPAPRPSAARRGRSRIP